MRRLTVISALLATLSAMAEFMLPPEPENVPPLMDGEDWITVRRAEVLKTMTEEVYGVRPVERPTDLSFETLVCDSALGGKAVHKVIRGRYSGPGGVGEMTFSAWMPAGAKKSPAFVQLSPRPPETIANPDGPIPYYYMPLDYIISRGYAAIAMMDYDLAPDWHCAPALATNGVFKAFGPANCDERKDCEWGILSAWAWGASRVMDWAETEPLLDAAHIGVVGLSRNGKAALVAGALDRRFAMTVSCCSGHGGAKLNHMRNEGSERVRDIMIAHRWFSPRYRQWIDRDEKMPFDQHWLLALVAPRLLYVSSAAEDPWAGPRGEFAACALATPAWESYGKAGLVHHGFPRVDHPLHAGNIGYHVRSGFHDIIRYDWQNYLDFADGHGWRAQAQLTMF